jgi:methylthioribulose-1-phosphate dehydratase
VEPIARELVEVGRRLHARGLAFGTGGNFSAVGEAGLVITASGVDKATLTVDQLVVVDAAGAVIAGTGKPSAETAIHLALVARGARAVLHVHSVWNTILSNQHDELVITGYEMLKGLAGVTTHEHRERVPVLPNSQDVPHLARQIERAIDPTTHGVLVAGHGLTTWGASLAEALRHVEIFEFLFEVLGRQQLGR